MLSWPIVLRDVRYLIVPNEKRLGNPHKALAIFDVQETPVIYTIRCFLCDIRRVVQIAATAAGYVVRNLHTLGSHIERISLFIFTSLKLIE